MLFLCSIQVDQFNISNIRVEKLQLKFDFSTTAFPGAELYVSINAQLPDSQLIFVQKVVVDTSTKTSISMSCDDQILLARVVSNSAVSRRIYQLPSPLTNPITDTRFTN
ncbi:Hypothetical_protein [Hexamita inflata]|uniref:Hypothetical_protein n=1 Tax=Hexamita inflata TaxID=28002 RepID=A0AA86NUW1_9EUKA|nr:Hypothetical protein HINF_LOCUS14260 [Hexamita inflata]